MLEAWRRAGTEVAVLGLGRSGAAASQLLRAHDVAVYASDGGSGPALDAQAALLRAAGASVDVGRHDLDRIRRAAAVVASPGIPPGAGALAAARAAGVVVLAEAELGLRCLPASRAIAITGTNGKTTTTALTAHLLAAAGIRAAAAGNIGRPLSQVALEAAPPEWLAVELS
jgi:UDP-N-acetylmuramoylalanine--D-glutamate ligase